MAFTTGTAVNAADLFARLIDFLKTDPTLVAAGQQWVQSWGDATELVMKGPGQTGTDSIYVGLRLHEDAPADEFWFECYGMTGVNSAAVDVSDHVNTQPTPSVTFLDNDPTEYWIVANGRRFIVVVKITTVYESCYAGWMLPYSAAGQYPYPMIVAGSSGLPTSSVSSPNSWRDDVDGHRGILWPNDNSNSSQTQNADTMIMTAANDWVSVANTGNAGEASMGPGYFGGNMFSSTGTEANFFGPLEVNTVITNAFGGDTTLTPAVIVRKSNGSQMLGAMHGVYKVQGDGSGAEDVITIGSVDYLVVPNVFRSGLFDYMALELS